MKARKWHVLQKLFREDITGDHARDISSVQSMNHASVQGAAEDILYPFMLKRRQVFAMPCRQESREEIAGNEKGAAEKAAPFCI